MLVPYLRMDFLEGEPGVLFGFAVPHNIHGYLQVLERGIELTLGTTGFLDHFVAEVGRGPGFHVDFFKDLFRQRAG